MSSNDAFVVVAVCYDDQKTATETSELTLVGSDYHMVRK